MDWNLIRTQIFNSNWFFFSHIREKKRNKKINVSNKENKNIWSKNVTHSIFFNQFLNLNVNIFSFLKNKILAFLPFELESLNVSTLEAEQQQFVHLDMSNCCCSNSKTDKKTQIFLRKKTISTIEMFYEPSIQILN